MLHQIWFDLGHGEIPKAPNGIETMKRRSGLQYKLWSYTEAVELIRNEMPNKINDIWDNLPHGINRADFFRYIILYKFGGIYFDIDFHCLKDLNCFLVNDLVLLSEEWPFSYKNGSLHNGILICKTPRHRFWLEVIEEVGKRLQCLKDKSDMQMSVFKLTGTSMLRDAALRYINDKNIMHNVAVLPYGIFCPLICNDHTYIDDYELNGKKLSNLRLPDSETAILNARVHTFCSLCPSVKIWQYDFLK